MLSGLIDLMTPDVRKVSESREPTSEFVLWFYVNRCGGCGGCPPNPWRCHGLWYDALSALGIW